MRLTRAKVSNYRNINGITVIFNPDCNYIIGENNLGKSNFLSLLGTLFSGSRGFDEKDFADPEKPIEIELDINLLPSEQGFFGDNFSPEDASLMKIRYHQKIRDAYPTIVSADSNESISVKMLKKVNFLKYETTSDPSKVLRLDTQKGAGLLIKGIIEQFISDGVHVFLNDEQVSGLMEFINKHLGKIRSFRDYSIKATIAPNQTEMLTSLIYLSDGERKIDTTGSGVQYMAMASINILYQIMELYKSKSAPFEEQLYTDGEDKKLLPLVLSIDEPEVHLHPYLQRSLIGYYKKILCNKDPEFAELLKLCFGVDGIDGQLIIVTHSTDALVGDYRNLVRFYKDGVRTAVISGYALRPVERGNNEGRIKSEDEKHLIMHFPEIKEAFYAKCAVLIEGDTEYGCITTFAEKLGISLDELGICVINAGGERSIKPIRQLLSLFAVPSIAIYDNDVKDGQTPGVNEFFTNEPCFEIEIVKTLYAKGEQNIVKQIAAGLDARYAEMPLDFDLVYKPFKKFGIDLCTEETCESCGHTQKVKDKSTFPPILLSDVADDNTDEFCRLYAAWFMAKKGVLLGRIIGDALTADLIPTCYADAIRKAKEVATSA
jgi:Predicted ATP-dependent endonuclease of the OLD family